MHFVLFHMGIQEQKYTLFTLSLSHSFSTVQWNIHSAPETLYFTPNSDTLYTHTPYLSEYKISIFLTAI